MSGSTSQKKNGGTKEMDNQKYYVTMTDTFTSGWGQAEGKINKLVFECQNLEEAEVVSENAMARYEMQYIRICTRKPRYNKSQFLAQYKTKGEYKRWYKKGAFTSKGNR